MKLRELIGSGESIGLFTIPFLLVGLVVYLLVPTFFTIESPLILKIVSVICLVPGIVIWIWSVFLILTVVPQHKLLTTGPYALVRHPLCTGVSLLVVPAIGFLLNTWFGLYLGIVVYLGSRIFAPQEEETLAKTFGKKWEDYRQKVIIPWL